MQNRRVRCPTNQANLIEGRCKDKIYSPVQRTRKLTVVFVQDVVDVAEEAAKPVEEEPLQRTGSLFLICKTNVKSGCTASNLL